MATQNLNGVGIATSYDDTNRLSVRGPATLFSHDGGGHQVKINKAGSGDTASLLFQSNWTGHAEMGLAGNTGFSIKVSPDGGSWTEALRLDPTTGIVDGAAVQASADDTTTGRLMRADYGYGPGNVLGKVSQNSGVPSGAVIEHGSNANGDYTRFADGTQICATTLDAVGCTTATGALFTSGSANWDFPIAFAAGSKPALSGNGGGLGRFIGFDTPSETQATFQVLAAISDATNIEPSMIAIGRWF